MNEFIMATDGYKLDHPRMLPKGTTRMYENFTPRATRIPGASSVVFFGLQSFLRRHLIDSANRTFFSRPKSDVIYDYQKFLDGYLGDNDVPTDHIAALHDLAYIPLEFCALPEGTQVPYKVPMFTIENTHDDFAWLPGYIETPMSASLWLPCTSATTALRYSKLLEMYAEVTGGDPPFVSFQGHDFSFRGMGSHAAAALSGAGHLLSFAGTDSIPAIQLLHDDYAGAGLIGGSVPATEHSVMCAGGEGYDELKTFRRLMEIYPRGVLSVVSDTWDLWKVLGETLPALKTEIMARNGKLVIRPDSGDPVLIITGDEMAEPGTPAHKGVIQMLWDTFGGRVNGTAYRELDSHIGAIYGDSITEERARQICQRLKDQGYASTNIVFGIGSYTYQFVTRDVHGFAIKATWARINGEERMLSKNPVTDSGDKKSARGRMVVVRENKSIKMIDGLTQYEQCLYGGENLLQPVWRNGRFLKRQTLADIRMRLRGLNV